VDAMPAAKPEAIERPRAAARRRSKRITLTVSVELSGKDVENNSFTLSAAATNLNRNGATLYVNRDLAVASIMVIANTRGARTSARIVAQTISGDLFSYGIEFLEPGSGKDFWGIYFPSRSHPS
jgi:hypothetical protein